MNLAKLPGYKINTEKSLAFLCTNDERSERENKETILFAITSKRIKYLQINLPKEAKDLYSENYKTLMKEIKDNTQMESYTMFLDWKNQYCENDYTTQSNLQIQCNPNELRMAFFTELEQEILQLVWIHKRP